MVANSDKPAHDIWQQIHAGQWYQTHNPLLEEARRKAKTACWQLNQLSSDDSEARQVIQQQLLTNVVSAAIGSDFACDYGFNIYSEGKLTLGNRVVLLDATAIRFGHNVVIADKVVMTALTHPLEAAMRKVGWQKALPISIGDNVVIGEGCTVLPGAIIAANSHIPPGTVITK